ncbi:MAG: DUF2948 family protein [Caulobacterales bacterium]|nr:DUF2948 family protein [Caulobacterales bacterium]
MARAPGPLRLLAEDADDLAVISAALQDAVAKIGDIRWDAAGRRLTIGFNRFRWESDRKAGQRVRSGLQLASVLNVQARRLRRDARGAVVSLLSVGFEPGEAPGGVIRLLFAGDGELRCEVECIDAALADVSTAWPTPRTPGHDA